MASSLADDLLKSRSIHDLRDLVRTLQTDADGKKADLQSMVGSQYQEFIQSADRIAKMQNQSHDILQLLCQLETHTQDSIKHVGVIIGRKGDSPMQDVLSQTAGTINLDGIKSGAVWNDLNKLDVFSATIKVLVAQALLDPTASIRAALVPEVLPVIAQLRMSAPVVRDLRSVQFLSDTIVHDAKLLCLSDSLPGQEAATLEAKSKALAAYRLLSGCTDADLLRLFVQSTDMELTEILQCELSPSAPTSHEAGLETLVKKLQQTIIDLFCLFCKPMPLSDGIGMVHGLVHLHMTQLLLDVNAHLLPQPTHPNSGSPAPALLALVEAPGSTLVRELTHEIKEYLGRSFAHITDQCQLVLQSISNALQVATLQNLIYHACTHLHYRSAGAAAQQAVRLPRIGAPSGAPANPSAVIIAYDQALYAEACYELLSTKIAKHKRAITGSINHAVHTNLVQHEAHTLLWNKVFYVLFLNIVETLLCKACEDIWSQSTQLLVSIFREMGLHVRVHPASSGTRTGAAQIVLGEVLPCKGSPTRPGAAAAPSSAQIYTKVEYVSSFFDHAVTKLLEDVIKPVHRTFDEDAEGGPNTLSLSSLTQALRLYCSKLCGQFLCTLRTVTQHLQAALYALSSGSSSSAYEESLFHADRMHGNQLKMWARLCARPGLEAQVAAYQTHFQGADRVQVPREQAVQQVLSGLLLMGRLAWNMKHRGGALYAALQSPQTPAQGLAGGSKVPAPTLVSASTTSFLSLEQLKSAFEIADTNGDGVLERDEAQEALQALSLPDDTSAPVSAPASTGSLLNQISTLTFSEFLLVFGTECVATTDNEGALEQGTKASFDFLIALSHALFAIATVQLSGQAGLVDSLLAEFGVEQGGKRSAMTGSFKATWVTQALDMDEGEGEGLGEQLSIPSQCSSALCGLLFEAARVSTQRLVSIDSMQRYLVASCMAEVAETKQETDLSDLNPMEQLVAAFFATQSPVVLADLAGNLLHGLLLEAVLGRYQETLQHVLAAMAHKSPSAQGTAWADEVLLQMSVDLQVCEHLSARAAWVATVEGYVSLRKQLSAHIDPVLAELLVGPLHTMSCNILQRSHLLLFPYAPRCQLPVGARIAINPNTNAANVVPTVFATTGASARFALLPLALLTSAAPTGKAAASVAAASSPAEMERGARKDMVASRTAATSSGSESRGGGIMGWFSSK